MAGNRTRELYDAIVLQCNDSAAMAASVTKAEKAGIPVITMNLDADCPHAALIAMIDIEAGRLVADAIAKEINQKVNVAVIQAPPGASKGERLDQGLDKLIVYMLIYPKWID
jgi:ribose transport system substrate-binding protein